MFNKRGYHHYQYKKSRSKQMKDEIDFQNATKARTILVICFMIVFFVWTRMDLQCDFLSGEPLQNQVTRKLPSTTAAAVVDKRITISAITTNNDVLVHESFDCQRLIPCSSFDDGNSTTQCQAFYPKRFWMSQLAAEFAPALHYQRINRPPICYEQELVMLTLNNSDSMVSSDNGRCTEQLPESLTYLHNFKAGGTTALRTLAGQQVPYYKVLNEHKIFTQYMLEDYEKNFLIMQRRAFETVMEIEQRQHQSTLPNYAFTFIRSPVRRFLSGVAQIESMVLEWEVAERHRHCYKNEESIHRIRCIIQDIQDTGIFYNVHLYPQMYLMDSWTNWGLLDLQIIVMDMVDMDNIFQHLAGNVKRDRESSKEGRKKLSINDIGPEVVKEICDLYKVDVLALQMMGMDDGLCPNYYFGLDS